MLRIKDIEPKKWVVLSSDLRKEGMRSPQGFSFSFGPDEEGGNYWWTTSEFAAYLFYKRHGCVDRTIAEDFEKLKANENYLLKLSSAVTSDKTFKSPEGFEYRPHQKAGIEYCLAADNCLVADEQRIGKEIPVSTPIATPTGWQAIGQLKVGDLVFAKDGSPTVINGVFPQGRKDTYKITFSDGYSIKAGLEHQWLIKSDNDIRRNKSWRLVNTQFLLETKLRNKKHVNWEIPITEPVQYEEKKYVIPPYILGVLIADGSLTGGGIRFVPSDVQVPKQVAEYLPRGYSLTQGADYGTSTAYGITFSSSWRNPFSTYLQEIGLRVTGEHKFLPTDYLQGSVEQRKLLLAGLLDCDGCFTTDGRVKYDTTSKVLAHNIVELAQSLGGTANIQTVPAKTRIRDGKETYELERYSLTIQVTFNPFKANHKEWRSRQKRVKRGIISVEKVGVEEQVCISVEHKSHTYLTEHYIVTHNTAIAIGVINNSPDTEKVLILCPKTAKGGWLLELNNWLVTKRKIQVLNSQTLIDKSADIYIANYDILHIQKDLQKIPFDLIIPDEGHLIARLDTRRAKFFLGLSTNKIIILSGTPLVNNPKDLLAIAQILDPFWKQFVHKNRTFISETGVTLSLEEAQEFLRSSVMIRRLQAQVFDNDPPIVQIVPIETPSAILGLVQVEKNGYKNLHKLEDYTKARRIIGIHKVPYAVSHINTYTTEGEKIVVFAHHRPVIERIASSLGNKAVVIYGQSSDAQREEAKLRFNKDPKCQVLVGSVRAASMALNLSVSSHIIFVEMDWANWAMEQAKERCSDKLQTKQVVIEYLAFDKSLDFYMLHKVDMKNSIVDKGLDLIYS